MTRDLLPPEQLPGPVECETCVFGEAATGAPCRFRITPSAKDQLLFAAGEVPTQVIHVRSGVVALPDCDLDGRERWWSLRGPGRLVGWEALREGRAAAAAEVHEAGELCVLTGPALLAWAREVPTIGDALRDRLLQELESLACERSLAVQSAPARTARYLLGRTACVRGRIDGATARSVARQLGIRHETLSRVLGRFARDGIVRLDPQLRILDRVRLERVAGDGSDAGS